MLHHFACYMIEGIQNVCYVKHAEDSLREEVCIFGLSDLSYHPCSTHTSRLTWQVKSTEAFWLFFIVEVGINYINFFSPRVIISVVEARITNTCCFI